jgi:uncharacterized RDD family membrane protein YckC
MRTHSLQGHYAGFLSRVVGVILDSWVIAGILTAGVYLITRAMGLVGADAMTCRAAAPLTTIGQLGCVSGTLALILLILTTGPVYYTLCWALVGQTVGQRLMGLRVLRLDGGELGMRRSVLRLVGFGLCYLTLGIGFLWVLIDDRRMGWHDKLARTCVIYDWKAEQNKGFIARVNRKLRPNRNEAPPAPQTGS